jgi:hypothetical protein
MWCYRREDSMIDYAELYKEIVVKTVKIDKDTKQQMDVVFRNHVLGNSTTKDT